MLLDEVVDAGNLCGVQNFGVVRVVAAQGDVLFDGATNEPDILQDNAQSPTQVGWIDLAHVHTVDEHRARIWFVKAQNQFGDRCFA